MPTVTKAKPAPKAGKNGKAKAPKGVTKEALAVRKIIYPDLTVFEGWGENAITAATMRDWLGWEYEKEYTARMKQAHPDWPDEKCRFDDERMFVQTDLTGERYTCWHNLGNRPFSSQDCLKYMQSILNRKWAGPTTFPGETVNGEAIVIGRTGICISLQHRGIALEYAHQKWSGRAKDSSSAKAHYQGTKFWPPDQYPDGPFMESLVVFGVSEDERVIQTVDTTKTRTDADMFATTVFKDRLNSEKKELSKMLGKAVDLLWRRTGHGDRKGNPHDFIRDHPETRQFVERHPRVLECVEKLWDFNKPCKVGDVTHRGISDLDLSTGHCAALLYLMGASASDGDEYRNQADKEGNPCVTEECLSWENWDQAVGFWHALATNAPALSALSELLLNLADPDGITVGQGTAKLGAITKAWLMWLDNPKARITPEDVEVRYVTSDKGVRTPVVDWPDFGGIDLGAKQEEKKEEDDSEEEPKEDKAARRKEDAKKLMSLKAPGEVASPEPRTVDKDGKPPAPKLKLKRVTRKDVEAEQTAKAKAADDLKMGEDYNLTTREEAIAAHLTPEEAKARRKKLLEDAARA